MKTITSLSLRLIVLTLATFGVAGTVAAQQSFQIMTLTTAGANIVEHEPASGDDRGGIALSTSSIFYTGDGSTGRFDISNLSNAASTGLQYDALVSNIRTKQVYSLGTSTGIVPNGGGMVTRLIPLDPSTGAQIPGDITLSTPLSLGTEGASAGIFSGWDRIVLMDGNSMNGYNIDLPSGQVTSLGFINLSTNYETANDRMPCENWATWGVAEYSGGTIKLAYAAASMMGEGSIKRYDVPTGNISTVADFPAGFSDLCSFTVDPSANRWYFHYEGYAGEFSFGLDENIGYANATFLGPSSASASISGKVLSSIGRGLSGVSVKVLNLDGRISTAVTNTFGYYSVPKLKVGETYIVSVESRRYHFPTSSKVVSLNDDVDGFNFQSR